MGRRQRHVIVVGGSAAGMRCACRLARLEPRCRVTVVERRTMFSYAACGLPYVLAGEIGDAEALRRTTDGTVRDELYFEGVKGLEVWSGCEATALDPRRRAIAVARQDGSTVVVEYDELVLATGARPRRLPHQPEHPRVRTFHTLDDLRPLHQGLARGALRRVVVIGGGLVGCELVEAFRGLWGLDVTMVERATVPLPGVLDREMAGVVEGALSAAGVRLVTGFPAGELRASEDGVEVSAGPVRVTADLAVVAIGVEPVVELARSAGLALGSSGGIAVDDRLATSAPGVWAAGDCVELPNAANIGPVHAPFGSLANREGRVLANVLAGRDDHLTPVVGAVAVKVFETNVAAVGLTRTAAEESGLAARSVWISTHDRPHYWPEAREIALSLVYSPADRRVLGVQAVGEGDVTKRVDVAAQLISRGGTLADFAGVEHAYAPPYAPAVEPLVAAAWVAEDQEDGVSACSPLSALEGRAVLDVRSRDEAAAHPAGATGVRNVPLGALRRAGSGNGDAPLLVVCERGGRAAEAVRWLLGQGKRAEYLGGGLRLRELAGGGKPR